MLQLMPGTSLVTGRGSWEDSRAINIGEVESLSGKNIELQYKGAGSTPFSRNADGRAVFRSSLREYLMSEAMYHLGISTTRALSLVKTGENVIRICSIMGIQKLKTEQ